MLNGKGNDLAAIDEHGEGMSSQRSLPKNQIGGRKEENSEQVFSNRSINTNGSQSLVIGNGSSSQYEVLSPGGTVKKKAKKQLKFGKTKHIKGMSQDHLKNMQRANINAKNSNYAQSQDRQEEEEEDKIPPMVIRKKSSVKDKKSVPESSQQPQRIPEEPPKMTEKVTEKVTEKRPEM